MSGIVQSCPANSTEVVEASSRLKCGQDLYGNNQYVCAPNVEKTALVELCYDGIMSPILAGNCLEVNEGTLSDTDCARFIEGCPEKYFRGSEVYKYPACLRINTDYKCYLADPSCPNITRQFTIEDIWESSTAGVIPSYEIPNTTEKGVYTTLPNNDIPVETIVGAVVIVLVVLIAAILIGIIVWKRRKKRTRRDEFVIYDYEIENTGLLEVGNKSPSSEKQDKSNGEGDALINQTGAVSECKQREDQHRVETEVENRKIRERCHSRNIDEDIKKRQNLGNLDKESESVVDDLSVSDDGSLTIARQENSDLEGDQQCIEIIYEDHEMEIILRYCQQQVRIFHVRSPHGCRLFYDPDRNDQMLLEPLKQELFGPDQFEQLEFPQCETSNPGQEEHTYKLLLALDRGVLLECHNGNIFATRKSRCVIFISTPYYNNGEPFKLERNVRVQVYDFHTYFERTLHRYLNGASKKPVAHFVIGFGQKIMSNNADHSGLLISAQVYHSLAKYRLNQVSCASPLSSSINISQSDDFDKLLKLVKDESAGQVMEVSNGPSA